MFLYSERIVMFTDDEHKFTVHELIFADGEHKFAVHKHKIVKCMANKKERN